ncbi:peptidoglycan-binding domain-containing protein [Bradyrhizobium erythrophlei]|uniref:Putative peptidoglycan binding domain-containing protein n=1 Tax=Bradyrhizobium erythrophlei TaxID=1437360 RepID=A0A1M5NMK5_9BRAD|nr:peptidoglycan-binding domain-containing protein [Bradyrhizobium erythrophlei]SHG90173.1 Putative peptidoglycan binding domain-containing protein [Bradyrhizobium erythrophlei]
MPRKVAKDDDKPRRRRGARAVAVDADSERGLAMRILLHSPKDTVAALLAFAAVSAILANALFLQTGHHPAPMFGSVVAMPQPGSAAANLLPRPRPLEADAAISDTRVAEQRAFEPRAFEPKAAEPRAAEPKAVEKPFELKSADPLGNLVKATNAAPAAPSAALRPPASIPASSHPELSGPRRVAAVQRVLTEYGYGQLKPTGTVGTDTQAAIAKFERERKLPVTGQVSDRLVRELAAVIGHPID